MIIIEICIQILVKDFWKWKLKHEKSLLLNQGESFSFTDGYKTSPIEKLKSFLHLSDHYILRSN